MKNLLTDKTLKAFDSLHELQNDLFNRINNQLESDRDWETDRYEKP